MRIAVATDLSQESGIAAKRAEELASALGAQLEILYVLEPDFWDAGGSDGLVAGLMSASPVEESKGHVLDDADITIKVTSEVNTFVSQWLETKPGVVLLEGRADREIARHTRDHDFLVVGAPANTVTRFGLGSVAERLCHRPHTRTLVVREGGDPLHWVVTVDFSKQTNAFVYEVMKLATARKAKVDLLHVVPAPVPMGADLAASVAVPYESLSMTALREWAEEQMKTVGEYARSLSDVPITTHLRAGYPVLGIQAFVEETGAGMVVMGSHGRGKLEDVLLGSVAWGVVKKMPTSVLLLPS